MLRSTCRIYAAVTLYVAASLGCSSDKQAGPAANGSLTVTVNASGDGVPGSVTISGPNGYTRTLAATATLSGLAPGSYTILADSSTAPDSVVGTITDTGTVTGSPATVTANTTATASVSYATKDRHGGLWIANNFYHTIPEYSSAQLRASGAPVPADTLATAVSTPAGLALDANGNMWVSSNSDTLVMYSPAARNAGGSTAPTAVLFVDDAIQVEAENLAFDAEGDLWVANCGGNLEKFTPSQLAAGGIQGPAITISGGPLSCPWGITVDSSGNVWVADHAANDIVEYSAAQAAAGGTPTPVVTITSGSVSLPVSASFDRSGTLWVANSGNHTVVGWTSDLLAASGSTAPAITITIGSHPHGTAFDNRGTLWVTDEEGVVSGLTSAQLAAGGSPVPSVVLTGPALSGYVPEQPLFDPGATAVGVSAARVRASFRSMPPAAPHDGTRSKPHTG
jgi:sugar lactone lactonase YvrE